MSLIRRTPILATAAFTLLGAYAPRLAALPPAERTLFTWNGTVDREVLISVRGRSVETRASGLDASFAPRLEVRDELPRQGGDIAVQLANGRGEVEIVQQPSARNDYTALLRVRDTRSGRDNYRLVVSWQPSREDSWDLRNRDRDDDRDRWDPRDRRDDDRGRGGDWDRGRGNGRGNDRGRRDNGALSWRGDVDDVAEIRIQGRRVEFFSRSGRPLRDVRYDLRGAALPRHDVSLDLDVSRGRGDVIVVQQPSPYNGYTAVIRVIDRRSGYGGYDFDLRWY